MEDCSACARPGVKEAQMNLYEAVLLVRTKSLEEQQGVTTGATAEKYKTACEKFSATITTAHLVWALEVHKRA